MVAVTITVTNGGRDGMDYAENGTAAVATCGPASPLSGDDARDFNISNGGEVTLRTEGCGGRGHGQRVPGNGGGRRREARWEWWPSPSPSPT